MATQCSLLEGYWWRHCQFFQIFHMRSKRLTAFSCSMAVLRSRLNAELTTIVCWRGPRAGAGAADLQFTNNHLQIAIYHFGTGLNEYKKGGVSLCFGIGCLYQTLPRPRFLQVVNKSKRDHSPPFRVSTSQRTPRFSNVLNIPYLLAASWSGAAAPAGAVWVGGAADAAGAAADAVAACCCWKGPSWITQDNNFFSPYQIHVHALLTSGQLYLQPYSFTVCFCYEIPISDGYRNHRQVSPQSSSHLPLYCCFCSTTTTAAATQWSWLCRAFTRPEYDWQVWFLKKTCRETDANKNKSASISVHNKTQWVCLIQVNHQNIIRKR